METYLCFHVAILVVDKLSRPAVSEQRLSLTPNGNVRYQLKTPYRDGTTHVIFEPLDFIARLAAALVPKPRVNLTRFHGVFAPNSKHRALVTPAKRGRGNQARVIKERPSPAGQAAVRAVRLTMPKTNSANQYSSLTLPQQGFVVPVPELSRKPRKAVEAGRLFRTCCPPPPPGPAKAVQNSS
jgi:hypothetical protein